MKIVIVGGGVFGASTAYHCARAGAEIVIVDAAHEGRATAAGAGIVSPWSSRVEDAEFYRLYAGGGRYYPRLIARLAEDGEHDTGFRKVGTLVVTADAGELAAMERLIRGRQAPEAGEISVLAPAEARKLFPPLREDLSAVHLTGGARVDGRRLADALLRAAERHGAVRRTGMASIVAEAGRVRGVRIGEEMCAADAVIVTAGAWAPPLLKPLGIELAVEPQRGQIVHLRLANMETGHWPVVLPLADHYLLTFDDQRVVVGATREWGAGFDYRVTAGGLAQVLRNALAVAPGLADATMIETRIGFRPMAADAKLKLGLVDGVPGLAIGNGLGASGLTIGPYAGKLLADLVLGGAAELDLAPYRPAG